MDTNSDGEITFEEFKECMNKVTRSTNRGKYLVRESIDIKSSSVAGHVAEMFQQSGN